MVKLIITDLDGTFLNSKSRYNVDYFQKTMERLQRHEIQLVACTGKHCERVEELFPDHLDNLWIVGDSATRIKKGGQVFWEERLETGLVKQLVRAIEAVRPDVTIILPSEETTYVSASIPQHDRQVARGSYAHLTELDKLSEWGSDPVIKLTVYDVEGKSLDLYNHLLPAFGEQVYMVPSEPKWLDITANGVHKGTTINILQEKLGVSYEETMVFGDGLNDIELMACGQYSYAMANAAPDLKAAAKEVVASNDEDGVLDTINRHLDELEARVSVSNRKQQPN